MNINNTSSIGFGAKTPKITRFYVPGKNDTTLRCFAEGDIEKISGINYDVLKKGKVIESEDFHNKQGFSDIRLLRICTKIQEKVREGYDFMTELIKAQLQ